jgi:hypothetical protein
MAYVERGGPPHFDGKGYQKWAARMMIFLRGKLLDFIVLDKTYAIQGCGVGFLRGKGYTYGDRCWC